MPSEFGGRKFASNFRQMIQDELAKAFEEGHAEIRSATQELKDTVREQARGAARVIREEAKHVRDTFGDYTANNAPDDEQVARELQAEKERDAQKATAAADPVRPTLPPAVEIAPQPEPEPPQAPEPPPVQPPLPSWAPKADPQ